MKTIRLSPTVKLAVGRDHEDGLDTFEIGVAWRGLYVVNLMIGRKQ